jgi:hypothetical protein
MGTGDGFGPEPALQLYFPANSDVLKVGKYGAAGMEKEAVGPALAAGEWHHVTLTYDRTATNLGTLALFVNGFAYGTVASVTMDVSQTTPLYLGGAHTTTTGLEAWFDGGIEDVTLQSGLSGRPVFARSTERLAALARRLDGALPIIGVGGIASAADARAKFEAGASLVQVYTGLIYRGPELVTEVAAA